MERFDKDVTYAVTYAPFPNVKAMLLCDSVIASMMLAAQCTANPFKFRSNGMAKVAFADKATGCL